MDVDMDIDLGLDPDIATLEAEAMNIESNLPTEAAAPLEDGLIDESLVNPGDIAFEKVHIRGLDTLKTTDIKTFATENFPNAAPIRIEWIDDTSANIMYEKPTHADAALVSFTHISLSADTIPSTQLRTAKPLSTHPQIELQVRQALLSDIKKPRAREASRFYLMNPDQDPRERRRHNDDRRGRRRDDNDRRRRRPSDEENSVPFDVNMYDDDEASLAARKPAPRRPRRYSDGSLSSDGGRLRGSRADRVRGDLFGGDSGRKGNGRLRDRSLSPARGRDGDATLGFDDRGSNLRRRGRSDSPPGRRRRDAVDGARTSGKDLFPGGSSSNPRSLLAMSSTSPPSNDLFANRLPSTSTPAAKELFPRKAGGGLHRRTGAFDAADELGSSPSGAGGADLFADRLSGGANRSNGLTNRLSNERSLADRISTPPSLADRVSLSQAKESRSLADRVTGGPTSETANGNVHSMRSTDQEASAGFTIRGTADSSGAPAKDLFAARQSRDLFDGKIKGRGAARRKAEDMFL